MDSKTDEQRIPLGRIIRFLLIFTTTLLAATWFVCATWNHFWKTAFIPVCQIIVQALNLLFVATTVLARHYSNFWLRLGYRISAIWLGILNYSFFAAGAAWAFSAATTWMSFHIEAKMIAATFLEARWPHEHLRRRERFLAARDARHRQAGKLAGKLARSRRGAGHRCASGQCPWRRLRPPRRRQTSRTSAGCRLHQRRFV